MCEIEHSCCGGPACWGQFCYMTGTQQPLSEIVLGQIVWPESRE